MFSEKENGKKYLGDEVMQISVNVSNKVLPVDIEKCNVKISNLSRHGLTLSDRPKIESARVYGVGI